MWYKLKRILIYPDGVTEKQVYPNVINKSIDLRWKTLAQIQAEWFDIMSWNGSYVLNSNWLCTDGTINNGISLYYNLWTTLKSTNIIKVKATWYIWGGSNLKWYVFIGTAYEARAWWTKNWTWLQYTSWTSSSGWQTRPYTNTTALGTAWGNWTTGNVNMEFTLDLNTWNYTGKITSPVTYNTSGTLTASQITNILTYQYISFVIVSYEVNLTNMLYTVEFTVE